MRLLEAAGMTGSRHALASWRACRDTRSAYNRRMSSLSRLLSPSTRSVPMQRETLRIRLDDGREIEVTRVRDPRARRIRLSVSERGARLTLPLRASLTAGDAFLREHRDWLATQLAEHGSALPLRRDTTTALPLRDASHAVHWEQGRYSHAQLRDDGTIVFAAPAQAGPDALRRALREFYEAQARADIARWMPTYLAGLPRPPSRVRLKVMSSQWGSLAPDGTLTLDLALVLGQPAAFEYVLVHELCHLIHADHSRAFWREVEARCPDWRHARDYFRDHGRRLKGDLHALLNA